MLLKRPDCQRLRLSQLFDQARDGVIDVVWTLPGYTAGRFPIVEVFELPFMAASAEATSQAAQAFVVEVGLITPPVGMNVFIINGLARDGPMIESFRGVLPFLVTDFIRVVLLIAFPVITLGLERALE